MFCVACVLLLSMLCLCGLIVYRVGVVCILLCFLGVHVCMFVVVVFRVCFIVLLCRRLFVVVVI